MPSRADWRSRLEFLLRAAALASLLALGVRAWLGGGQQSGIGVASTASLDSSLVTWTVVPPERAVVVADILPDARQRDWLRALRRTGLTLGWQTRDSSGTALVVEASPLAGAPHRITVATDSGAAVAISDDLGVIDSARAGSDGTVRWEARFVGAVQATVGGSHPATVVRDSLSTRPVLLLGQVGWESKFVLAALEEARWSVAARLTIAPNAAVTQGPIARLDTASYSALIVLDSSAVFEDAQVARFVADGGGLVAAGTGALHRGLRRLLPARVLAASGGIAGALLGPAPRTGLSSRTFGPVPATTVALERRGEAPVVVAQRVGAGRVVVVGYDDTWRLRMVPTADSAPAMHREWWSAITASVVNTQATPLHVGTVDEAPYAATVEMLGRPMSEANADGMFAFPWEMVLAALAFMSLLAEWLSRRLRGLA